MSEDVCEELKNLDFDYHLLNHGRIFDLQKSIEDTGLDFEILSENNFESLMKDTLLQSYFDLRKAYQKKDFLSNNGVRFFAHKLKTPFGYYYAQDLCDRCKELQDAADNNDPNIDQKYKAFIKDIYTFFEEFYKFSKEVGKELDSNLVEEFRKLSKEYDMKDEIYENQGKNQESKVDKLKNVCTNNNNSSNNITGNNSYIIAEGNNINKHSKVNNNGENGEIDIGDPLSNGKINGMCCSTDCIIF